MAEQPRTPSGQRLLDKNTSRDTATNEWLLNDILAIEREAASGLDVLDWLIAFDWLIAHEHHTLHFGRDHGGGAHLRCASPDGGYLRIAIPSRAGSSDVAPSGSDG